MSSKVSKYRTSNPGIYVSGGTIEQSDFDTTSFKDLMQDYSDMRNGDCIASTSVEILTTPILNSKFLVNPSILNQGDEPSEVAKEAADYVAWVYDNLEIGIENYIRHKLLSLSYGLSVFERVWGRGKEYQGKITNTLVDLSPIQPDTINRFFYDEKAILTGIEQYKRVPEHGQTIVTIDSEYLHIWSPFSEFGNPLGRSLLRPSRLLYKIKKQIWTASGRAASRGAGIPEFVITATGNNVTDSSLKTKMETIAKNIGNSENSYVISQKDLVEFKLHTLQNQEMNLGLIEQANREMWYNTLSQFVTSGIGENGSRAATGEHKGPYFEALNSIIRLFEISEYENIEAIIENSPYYGKLDESEYPCIKLERAKESDLAQVYQAFQIIKKTPEDEMFIRNVLGLPEVSLEAIEEKQEEKIEENNIDEKNMMEEENGKEENSSETAEVPEEVKAENVQEEAIEEKEELKACPHCLKQEEVITTIAEPTNIFEFKAASESVSTADAKAEAVINDVMEKAIEDAAIRLDNNPKKTEIKLGYKKELIDRLESIYNTVFEHGSKDVIKEYAKISRLELAIEPIQIAGSKGKLAAKVDTLYSALENAIRDELKLINKQVIENAGGMRKYIIDRFTDTQKAIRSQLISIASGGYISGRSMELSMLEEKDPELKRRYETSLEGAEKICEVCRPYNNMTFSDEQAEYVGLDWEGDPINPLCLGGNNCRCVWVPAYSVPNPEDVKFKSTKGQYELAGESEGTWVTINGAHVMIDSEGTITKGPKDFVGKNKDSFNNVIKDKMPDPYKSKTILTEKYKSKDATDVEVFYNDSEPDKNIKNYVSTIINELPKESLTNTKIIVYPDASAVRKDINGKNVLGETIHGKNGNKTLITVAGNSKLPIGELITHETAHVYYNNLPDAKREQWQKLYKENYSKSNEYGKTSASEGFSEIFVDKYFKRKSGFWDKFFE